MATAFLGGGPRLPHFFLQAATVDGKFFDKNRFGLMSAIDSCPGETRTISARMFEALRKIESYIC
jgi:hypothetical protein